jgi:hypothetical protein
MVVCPKCDDDDESEDSHGIRDEDLIEINCLDCNKILFDPKQHTREHFANLGVLKKYGCQHIDMGFMCYDCWNKLTKEEKKEASSSYSDTEDDDESQDSLSSCEHHSECECDNCFYSEDETSEDEKPNTDAVEKK